MEIDWIVVCKTVDPIEAKMIRLTLEQNDITVMIENETSENSPIPNWSPIAPLIIRVPAYQRGEARSIIREISPQSKKTQESGRSNHPGYLKLDKNIRFVLICVFSLTFLWILASSPREENSSQSKSVLAALMKALQDNDVDVRRKSAILLGKMGPQAAPAVPQLIEALSDEDLEVRTFTISALGNIGNEASSAIPHLQKIIQTDSQLKEEAMLAIQQIQEKKRAQ